MRGTAWLPYESPNMQLKERTNLPINVNVTVAVLPYESHNMQLKEKERICEIIRVKLDI